MPKSILRLFAVLLLSLSLAGVASAQSIQVRWVPPTTPGVVGYNVYIAPMGAGPIIATPIDVGRPATNGAGVATATVIGNRAIPLAIEMASYDAQRRESARSNRMFLVPGGESLGSAVFSADFQTSAIGSNPASFLDQGGDFRVAALAGGNRAFAAPTATGIMSTRYLGSGSGSWLPYEITGSIFVPSGARVAGLAVHMSPDLSKSFRFGGDSGGVFALQQRGYSTLRCASSTSTGVSVVGNTTYRVRLRFTAPGGRARLRAKAWRSTDAEPAAWQADCWTDLALTSSTGSLALYREGSGAVSWDDLVVRPVTGTLEPIP